MGSDVSRSYRPSQENSLNSVRNRFPILSQYSLSSLTDGFRSFSFASLNSNRTSTTNPRQKIKISRRRWHESTISNPFGPAKTSWPVATTEALFLPDFKVCDSVNESCFNVIKLISKGAFGEVHKVKLKETNDLFAMKILHKSKIIQQNCVNQIKDEVKIQSMCGHNPFIVSCPFYWQNKSLIFIVTEYVPMGDLYDFAVSSGPLPEDLVKIYVAELALALDFLHNAGVIFRDLKPENVLLDENYHVKLIDFGLAKWLHYGSRTSTICGTLNYIAPEVFQGPYGHSADWWSLGVLSCFLITLKMPGAGNKSEEAGALPEGPSIPVKPKDLILRLLTVDPNRRLRSLLTLKTIPFFMGFDFAAAQAKQLLPELIVMNILKKKPTVENNIEDFSGF